MKTLYTTLLLLIIGQSLMASPVIRAIVNNGQWTAKGTWDLNRLPKNGDTIIIPSGIRVELKNKTKTLTNVYLIIEGELQLNKGKLKLKSYSTVDVKMHGALKGVDSNDWVKINDVLKFSGSELTVAGPSLADGNTGISPMGFMNYATLPVRFSSFIASRSGSQVQLIWTTAEEINNNRFEVEKSLDGSDWSVIGMVLSTGNGAGERGYRFADKWEGAKTLYYRIKQVDMNGKSTYSAVQMIRTVEQTTASVRMFATSKQSVHIDLNREMNGLLLVRLYSLSGRLVAEQRFNGASSGLDLRMNQTLSGLYVVQVTNGAEYRQASKILF